MLSLTAQDAENSSAWHAVWHANHGAAARRDGGALLIVEEFLFENLWRIVSSACQWITEGYVRVRSCMTTKL